MKISMWMLHDALNGTVLNHNLSESSQLRQLSKFLPYLRDETVSDENVYLVNERDLAEASFPKEACIVICNSGVEDSFDVSCSYIRLKHGIGYDLAMTRIINAFCKYNDWYDRLREELIGTPDLTRVCNIGNELIHNYITLFDPNLILLAYSALPPWMFNLILEKKRGPYYALTEDAYKAMVSSPYHKDDITTRRAVYTTDPTLGLRVLYVNVGLGEFDCRLCIGENERRFRESDGQLCEVLGEVLFSAMKNNFLSSSDTKTTFRELLSAMLSEQKIDERALDKVLSEWQWNQSDRFICLRVEKRDLAVAFTTKDRYVCSRLEDLLEDACSFVLEGSIACVTRLPPGETIPTVVSRLEVFFKDSGFIVGISNEFNDFTSVRTYYKESVISVQVGGVARPDHWYYLFEVYAYLHFFAHGTSVLPAIHFCDCDIRRLLINRGAKVDYYETLRVYLENDRNLLNTAKALRIHRTTLFYRLNKINEIIESDINDPNVRLRMMFSISILEIENNPERFIPG